MKNKIISIHILLIFLFTSLISVNAIASTPRVDLDDYQLLVTDINNVYINGTVSISKGQMIGLYDSGGKILYNYKTLNNTNSKVSFKLQIPDRYLKDGTNTFKIKSLPIKGIINGSNPKTLTVKVGISKKDQTINANDINIKVNETKNIDATVTSNLPLSYTIENSNIATVTDKGVVVGRKAGNTKIIISQSGNGEYNPTNKTINVIVNDGDYSGNKKNQTINTNFDSYQFLDVNKSIQLSAKTTSGLTPSFKSSNGSIVSIDKNGKLTSKKSGSAIITITVPGNNQYNSTTKKITVKVPKIKDRRAALQPWFDSMKWAEKHMQYAKYDWGSWSRRGKTLKAAKNYGTCCTYPCVVAVHLNLIKDGKDIGLASGEGTVRKSTAIKAMKSINKNYWSWYDVKSKTTKSLVKSGKVLPGDVLGANNHVFIYTGKNKKGKLLYSHSGKQKGSSKYKKSKSNAPVVNKTSSKNDTTHKVKMILRVNTFDVKTSCVNGTITQSNKYMASQTVKVTYTPMSGKKLKSVKVDGKNININKYKNSYTINKLDKNHTIEVVFN